MKSGIMTEQKGHIFFSARPGLIYVVGLNDTLPQKHSL